MKHSWIFFHVQFCVLQVWRGNNPWGSECSTGTAVTALPCSPSFFPRLFLILPSQYCYWVALQIGVCRTWCFAETNIPQPNDLVYPARALSLGELLLSFNESTNSSGDDCKWCFPFQFTPKSKPHEDTVWQLRHEASPFLPGRWEMIFCGSNSLHQDLSYLLVRVTSTHSSLGAATVGIFSVRMFLVKGLWCARAGSSCPRWPSSQVSLWPDPAATLRQSVLHFEDNRCTWIRSICINANIELD